MSLILLLSGVGIGVSSRKSQIKDSNRHIRLMVKKQPATPFLISWAFLAGVITLWFNHNSVITDCQAILCVITVFIRNYEFLL